jgi:hypothetical protein
MPQPGIVSWQSHEEVVKARRRTIYGAVGLGLVAAMWVPAFFEGFHSDAFTGGVILEVFTLVPLVLVLIRLRRLTGLIRRMKALGGAEQEEDAEELRRVDEALFRMARLARQLRGEVAASAGYESFTTAEHASREWRRLLQRQHDLESMIEMTTSSAARASLERSLEACRDDAADFQSEVEELAAALAQLVDSSDEGSLGDELARVQTAGERVEALAVSFKEINAVADQSLGAAAALQSAADEQRRSG